jgi:hypothetical protein
MNHLIICSVLSLGLSPLALGQSQQVAQENPPQSSSIQRTQAIRNAHTICIHSETAFLTVSTLERSLLKQKNWDRLGLNILDKCGADIQIDIDRLHFTHIHTYVLTDKKTGIVLAANRVRAFDGVGASGPMAEQIVKILSAARLLAQLPAPRDGL